MRSLNYVAISLTCAVLCLDCSNNPDKNAGQPAISAKKSDHNLPSQNVSIHEAALNGNFSLVTEWLAKGNDVDVTDKDGRTALMYAAYNGHKKITEVLLKHKAQINLTDHGGRTALMFAASGPYPETVKLLLDHQADPNFVDFEEHFTALMFAACEGQTETVRLLLERKADPNLKDIDGDNALRFAVKFGHTESAKLLRAATGK